MVDFEQLTELIEQAPGPSPWYYGRRVSISSIFGPLAWKGVPSQSSVALMDPQGHYRLVLGIYSYALLIQPRKILVWHEVGNVAETKFGIETFLLQIDDLSPLKETIADAQARRSESPKVMFSGGLVASVTIPSLLKIGLSDFEFPAPFQSLPEVLMLADNRSIATSMKRSIYCLRPGQGRIEVLPQDWFNDGDFDFGYQWITKVVRDPVSQRVAGTGIRIRSFILDETGRRVEHQFD